MPKREKVLYGSFFAALIGYALTVALGMFSYERASLVWPSYLAPLVFIAIGTMITCDRFQMNPTAWICMLFPLWYLLCHLLNGEMYLYNAIVCTSPLMSFIKLCSLYGLFLWVFAVCPSGIRKKLLHMVFYILFVACFLFACIALVASFVPGGIVLPFFGTEFVIFKGSLSGAGNANVAAIMMTVGSILALYLMASFKRVWVWNLGIASLLIFYAATALANSRTCMIAFALCCGILATLFCLRTLRGGKVKKVCLSLAVGAVCAALLFTGFKGVVIGYNALKSDALAIGTDEKNAASTLSSTAVPQPVETAETISLPAATSKPSSVTGSDNTLEIAYKPLTYALSTFTGRTTIWRDTLQYCIEHPKTLLTGVLEDKNVRILTIGEYHFTSTHNAWLQTLLTTGIPGLAVALFITFLALKAAWRAVQPTKPFAHAVLAAGLVALLTIGLMESVLFLDLLGGYTALTNMVFFLILGYLRAEQGEASSEALPG